MNPFDLPGTAFVGLYLVVLAAAIVAANRLRWALRSPGGEPDRLDLEPYAVAYLAGGSDLAVNAALASLCQRGALAVDASGSVIATDDLPPSANLLEAAVYRFVRRRGQGTIKDIRENPFPEIDLIRHRLEAAGLILAPEKALRAWLRPVLLVLTATVFGGVKIAVGLSRERPVAFLVFLTVLSLIAAGVLLCAPTRRTRRGDRALELLRLRNAALRTSASHGAGLLDGRDLAFAVGLFGVAVLYGGPMAPVAHALQPSSTGGGGGGCGGGGGGGCGGGCGGCGGCGG